MGGGTHPDGINFPAFDLYPAFKQILCENSSGQKVVIVLLQSVKGFGQGSGKVGNPSQFALRQSVEILI